MEPMEIMDTLDSKAIISLIRKKANSYIKEETNLSNSLNILEIPVELYGQTRPILQHIGHTIKHMTQLNKIQLILTGLKKNINIDPNTFNYESINTICEDVIIGMITAS